MDNRSANRSAREVHASGIVAEGTTISTRRDAMRRSTNFDVKLTVSVPDSSLLGMDRPPRPGDVDYATRMLVSETQTMILDLFARKLLGYELQSVEVVEDPDERKREELDNLISNRLRQIADQKIVESFSPTPHYDITVYDEEATLTPEQWDNLKSLEIRREP